jgi:ABC-type multidrug transport system fused ATPase/permease subunit
MNLKKAKILSYMTKPTKSNLFNAWGLLSRIEKIRYVTLIFASFFRSIFDLAILSMTVVIVAIATSESDNQSISFLFFSIKTPSSRNFDPSAKMTIAFALLLVLVLGKNTINVVIQNKNFKMDARIGQRFTADLLHGYLNQSFSFFIQNNSTEMLRNLDSGKMISSHLLRPVFEIAVQLFGIVLIVCVLLLTNLVATVVTLGGLASLSILIYKKYGMRFKQIGEIERSIITQRSKSGSNAILGIRDIKVSRRENEFFRRYVTLDIERANYQVRGQMINEITPMMLETVVALTLVAVSLLFWSMNLDNQELVTFVALFAVGSLRLVPNFSKVIAMKQMILYGDSYISDVISDLTKIKEMSSKGTLSGSELFESVQEMDNRFILNERLLQTIQLKGVSFRYPNSNNYILSSIDLSIQAGAGVGIIGKSGAGKSTLVDLLLGLLIPTEGEILLGGRAINEAISEKRLVVGYVPQSVYFTEGTVRENIAFGFNESEVDEELVREVVHLAELDKFVSNLPHGLDSPLGELGKLISGGERQRIGIARALYRRPNLLILDEATSSLDIQTERNIVQTISKLKGKITTITVAHRLSTIEHCEMVAVIEDSTVSQFGPPQVVIPYYLEKMSH